MANVPTTNYAWTKPEVGADTDAWGTHWNANLDSIDSTLFTVSGVASAALPKSGGTMTGALAAAVGLLATPGLTWAGDLNSGAYWIGADHWALVAGGASVLDLTATTVTVPVALTATGAFNASGTITAGGKITGTAGVTGAASLNLPHGVAPTSPVNGDEWTTTAGAFHRINGATKTVAYTDNAILAAIGSNTILGNNTGGAAIATALTAAQVKTLLAIANTDVSGLGTAAAANTGVSGATVPLLSASNLWSLTQIYSSGITTNGVATVAAGMDITGPLSVMSATESGYMGLPQNSQSSNYGIVATDRGKGVHFTASATATIPANASVAFPIGTVMEISAAPGATISIAITFDTLRLIPTNSTGTRTLVGPGSAYLEKKTATEWWIRGDCT